MTPFRSSLVTHCPLLSEGIFTVDCKKEKNLDICGCTYEPCARKGICCDCVFYHLQKRQLPGCFFPKDAEKTYDRSFEHFADLVGKKRV
ncbi:MAG: DUF6485 family protein [Smithellaceae bacterium]|nr:DUF6485 family protein [Smithellaceae bacterium]